MITNTHIYIYVHVGAILHSSLQYGYEKENARQGTKEIYIHFNYIYIVYFDT